jgi:hypothetical protein
MHKRWSALERQMEEFQRTIEYQQTVAGIRRGLESADRGEGEPARSALSRIRRKRKRTARRA